MRFFKRLVHAFTASASSKNVNSYLFCGGISGLQKVLDNEELEQISQYIIAVLKH